MPMPERDSDFLYNTTERTQNHFNRSNEKCEEREIECKVKEIVCDFFLLPLQLKDYLLYSTILFWIFKRNFQLTFTNN